MLICHWPALAWESLRAQGGSGPGPAQARHAFTVFQAVWGFNAQGSTKAPSSRLTVTHFRRVQSMSSVHIVGKKGMAMQTADPSLSRITPPQQKNRSWWLGALAPESFRQVSGRKSVESDCLGCFRLSGLFGVDQLDELNYRNEPRHLPDCAICPRRSPVHAHVSDPASGHQYLKLPQPPSTV